MYSNHYKIISSISVVFIALLTVFIPLIISLSIFAISLTCIGSYYVSHNYDIEYKYWFSFVGQLLGLILIVSSIVVIFSLAVNLTMQ